MNNNIVIKHVKNNNESICKIYNNDLVVMSCNVETSNELIDKLKDFIETTDINKEKYKYTFHEQIQDEVYYSSIPLF